MMFKVSKAIKVKSPPLEELKSLILFCNNDLKGKLDDCSSVSSVVYLIKEERDIELLRIVVEELEITEAERYIEQYKATMEDDHCCSAYGKSILLSIFYVHVLIVDAESTANDVVMPSPSSTGQSTGKCLWSLCICIYYTACACACACSVIFHYEKFNRKLFCIF